MQEKLENSLTFVVQVVAYNRIFPRGHFVLSLLESNPCFDAKLSGSLYYNLLHLKLYVPSAIKSHINLALLTFSGLLTKLKVDWHKSERKLSILAIKCTSLDQNTVFPQIQGVPPIGTHFWFQFLTFLMVLSKEARFAILTHFV